MHTLSERPLSPLQRGMLFDHLTSETPEVDVLQVVGTLEESLDVPALATAWERTAHRHAALRSHFRWEGLDEPLRVVASEPRTSFEFLDESGATPEKQRDIVARLMDTERLRGFDLSRPPLARLTVLGFEPNRYAVVLTVHHVLMDAVSFPALLRDLFAICEATASGESISLPPIETEEDPAAPSGDQEDSGQEAFWRELLSGFTVPTPIPSIGDRDQLDVSGSRRGEAEICLPEETTDKLRALASSLGVTLSTLVEGAWAVLLSRYCGEDDVVFGAVRRVVGAANDATTLPIGLFINTLPMRARLDGSIPLAELLQQVRKQHVAIGPHRHTPLVDIRQHSEVPGRTALFDTFVVFNHESLGRILRSEDGSWSRREFRLAESLSSIPLGLYAYADPSLLLRLVFDRHRCDEASARRTLEHVECLLSGMTDGAHEAAASLPMLTSAETQLLDDWNDTRRSDLYPRCVHELIEERARMNPDAVALSSSDREVSYQELDSWADVLADELRRKGVGPDVLVGIYLTRSIEMVVGILATLKAGGAYLPLDPDFPQARIAYMLDDARVPVVLTEARIAGKLPKGAHHVMQVQRSSGTVAEPPNSPSQGGPSPSDLAYVIYTSGSTGNPKGVMVEHRTVVNFFRAMDERIECVPEGVWLAVTSLSFDISVLELLWTLTKGFNVLIYPGESGAQASEGSAENAFRLGDYLERYRVTHMQCTPSMALMMTMDDACRNAMGSLRQLLIGGEAFPSDLADELRGLTTAEIINMYGPTETTIWSSTFTVPRAEADGEESGSVVPIGRPVLNTTFYVLDRHLRPVPPGVAGELFIGGEGVTRGYLNRASLTRDRFIPDPKGASDDARLYRTGDLVRHGSDGCLHFLGRMDNQVKLRGHRIEPGEIEQHIQRHPGIEHAAVVAYGSAQDAKHLRACLVATAGVEPSEDELRAYLRELLPDYMVPGEFMFLDQLPLTPNKKLDRKALADLRPSSLASDQVPVRDGLESQVAAIWCRVLGARTIGRDDNFFDLGGDSFLAMKLHHELREALGRGMSLIDIFRYPTVRLLAEHLGRQGTKEAVVRKAIERGKARRMRRMQSRKDRAS